MTNGTVDVQRLTAVAGAPRRSDRDRQVSAYPSMWQSAPSAAAPKPIAHVATKTFGGNATPHPRPEEAPL